MTFDRYVVTNSLCCPSRASIFTGRYPHSTGVLTNMPPAGGFEAFHPSRREHVRDQPAGGRLHDGADGQVPQRLPAAGVAHGPARLDGVGGRRARPTPVTTTRLLVKEPGRRPKSCATATSPRDYLTDVIVAPRPGLHRRAVEDRPAVPARAVDLRAARAVHARARATRGAFPALTAPRSRCSTRRSSARRRVASTQAAQRRRDRRPRPRLPPARAVRAGRRPHDRRRARAAARLGVAEQHVHRLQLRQRLPHGRAAADGRASRPRSTTTSACR